MNPASMAGHGDKFRRLFMEITSSNSSVRRTRPAFPRNPSVTFHNFRAAHSKATRDNRLSSKDVRSVPAIFTANPIVKKSGSDTIVFAAGLDGIRKINCTGDRFEVVSFLAYPGVELPVQSSFETSGGVPHKSLFVPPLFLRSGKTGRTVNHLVDKDGSHYAAFGGLKVIKTSDDSVADKPLEIVRIKDFSEDLPAGFGNFPIIEMRMTHDGHIAILSYGILFLCDRDLKLKKFLTFPGEIICNSLCIDEQAIYVVTSRRILKIAWTGTELSYLEADGGWETEFNLLSSRSFLRSGPAHSVAHCQGSTPMLMGSGQDPDKLILISRKDELGTKLFAFWRDQIPQGLSGRRKASRIADQFRIDFATSAVKPLSAVHGYGMVLINSARPQAAACPERHILFGAARSTTPNAMKFSWNVRSKSFERDWLNSQIDSTNHSYPVVSERDGLIYLGHKASSGYQFVAMDWNSGAIRERWMLPDRGRSWNTYGGATMLLDNGDFLIGGYLTLNRIRTGR